MAGYSITEIDVFHSGQDSRAEVRAERVLGDEIHPAMENLLQGVSYRRQVIEGPGFRVESDQHVHITRLTRFPPGD